MAKETAERTAAAAEQPRTVVYLGNRNAIAVIDEERVAFPGKRCTTVRIRPDASLLEAAHEIVGPTGVWQAHSDAAAPAWVAAEGPLAQGLIAIIEAQYPGIEVRDPDPDDAGAEAA